MAAIQFAGCAYDAREGESVLECLERHGVSVSHSCRRGVCQSCLMRVTEGEVPAPAQPGLKPVWKARGYVLACMTPARAGLALDAVDAAPFVDAHIEGIDSLNESVVRVWVRAPNLSSCQAGQFVQLQRRDGLTRPYSVANLPIEGLLELHIAVRPGGRMSGWLASAKGSATAVKVRGPFGDCVYLAGQPQQQLVLVGTGTGLAPLLGVTRAALGAGHTGPIQLYHGSRTASGLYHWRELSHLAERHPNLTVVGCVRENDLGVAGLRTAPLEQCVLADHPTLAGARVFLCGNPELVRLMRKKAYLAGAPLDRIHSDPFVEASVV